MAFWKFIGGSPESYPARGITAKPGEVYAFGPEGPPDEPQTADSSGAASTANWQSDPGPATNNAGTDALLDSSSIPPYVPQSNAQVPMFNGATATTATTGANGALPATVAGYLTAVVGGTTVKIPYFNV